MTTTQFTQAKARETSTITFRHTDGSEQGGAVGGAQKDRFAVTSFPRYGDTDSHWFRYEDVAEIIAFTPRVQVPLATFDRLMNGGQA
jgi:hypothetical protein